MVKTADMGEGTYTAKITHGDTVVEETFTKYSKDYHCVSYKLAAKQMSDVISVEVYDENGNCVSDVYKTSVRAYAMNMLGKSTDPEIKTLLVDMLNYGTEAQYYFDYKTDDTASRQLTSAQRQLASKSVSCTDKRVKGANYYGSNLSLEDKILLNLFFRNVQEGYTAKVSYTDFRGEKKSFDAKLEAYSGSIYKVVIDEIVLADAFSPVTVTVYDALGNVHGTGTDSVESYVARTGSSAINSAIMKFAYSAKAYLS